MTASTAVASLVVAPAASRAAAPTDSRDPTASTSHFGRQLDAARQQAAPESPRKPDTATRDAHKPDATKSSSDNTSNADSSTNAHAATTAVASAPAAAETLVASTLPQVNAAPDDTVAAKPADDAGDTGDQAAAAMATAMLALLGPAAAAVLRPTAAGASTDATVNVDFGKGATGDDNANALQQSTDADGAVTAAASVMPMNLAALSSLGDAASRQPDTAKDSLSGLTQAVALPAPAQNLTTAAMPLLQLSSPVGSQAFAQELGQQVAWLGGQGIQQARIRLHPEDLGQLDVKVSVTHDRVDVVFTAQHPAAVTAVQQTLPQLDHLLAQHGLSLGHAEVGQHDRGNPRGQGSDGATANAADDPGEVHGVSLPTSLGSVSLLDAFA